MNTADYAAGCVALILTVLPWPFAGYRLSRRLLSDWDGAASALVAAVIAISGLLVVAELLGMAGQFARWQLAAASVVVAGALWWLAKPAASGTPDPPTRSDGDTPDGVGVSPSDRGAWLASLGLAVLCAMAVSAALLGRDARVLHTGPSDADSLHYHLSDAADFVQSRSINEIHHTAYSDASAYYPHDDELLDAVAMLGPRPDIATLGVNLGFGWLALLACWVIGARWKLAAATVAAGSSALAIPLVAAASSGPGLNDIPAIASLLAAVAIAVHAEVRPQRWLTAAAVAGLAVGLGAGSKISLLGVVVLLALAVVVCAPARRLATAGVLTGAAVLTGGFWYVRDWVAVGSPVPEVDLTIAGHGLHAVPYPLIKPSAFTVAHYLTDGSVIHHWFLPQLKVVVTPLWPVVLGLAALGIVVAVVTPGERLRRLLAVVAVAGVALYLVTPTTALGKPGRPVLFGDNVRYVVPVIALSVVLFATAKPFRRLNLPVTVGFTVLTFVLLASSTTAAVIDRPEGWAAAVLIAAAVGWGYAGWRLSPSRALSAAVVIAGLLAVTNAGWFVQRDYLRDRYTGPDPRDQLAHVANLIRGERIGVAGFPMEYPFYGLRLDNQVEFIGVSARNHSFGPPRTCESWRRELVTGRYRYVVVEPQPVVDTKALLVWTASIPGSRVVMINRAGTMVSLPRHIEACPPDQSPSS